VRNGLPFKRAIDPFLAARTDVPRLVKEYLGGQLPIDHYVTHTFTGVEHIPEAVEALHSGDCLRAVVKYF
jgi:S-(hydroxymethyl)glutathione dehydrogenase/alcohol dehydrogenase